MKSVLVKDCMVDAPVSCEPGTNILHAAQMLSKSKVSGAPVLDRNGRIVGVITEQDCIAVALQAYYHGMSGGIVGDHMTVVPRTVTPEDTLLDVAQLFLQEKFHGYPVVSEGHFVGVIWRRDVLRVMVDFFSR